MTRGLGGRGGEWVRSEYDQLSIEIIMEFYWEIKLNIEKKMLSEAMLSELHLLEEAAKNRGVLIKGY